MSRPTDRKIQAADIARCRAAFKAFCTEKGISPGAYGSVAEFKKSRECTWTYSLDELDSHVRDRSED